MKKKAFTLAEVIITIIIILTVAFLTLPSFLASHQSDVQKPKIKKSIQYDYNFAE